MLNPKLTPKAESILTVNDGAKRLFQVIYQEQHKEEKDDDTIPRIKVSSFVSKMAFYYEKIRNTVDYKEEHLLRKNAILRILRRQILIEGAIIPEIKSKAVAKHLLTELIRAAYLPNNKVRETKIDELAEVIDKYIKLKNYALRSLEASGREENNFKAKNELTQWIITLLGCDIEERLGRSRVNQTIISDLYDNLDSLVEIPEDAPYRKDKDIQIYIAIHRNLLKFDSDMVAFISFKYFNADWHKAGEEEIARIGRNILVLRDAIERQINHPLSGQLKKIVGRYAVFYEIVAETIADNPVRVYEDLKADPKAFPRDIKKICKKRYGSIRSKLWRSAVRSIIYIFLTKSLFAVLLEVPATRWFGDELNFWALGVNIGFPALLLFIIILFTKLPSDNNTNRIIEGINEVVFVEKERKEPIRLREPAKRGNSMNVIFGLVYGGAFLFSFGVIIYALEKIGFHWISITIFLFFLALVSFFAIRIRRGVHELVVVEPKENIFTFLSDFFYIPIVAVGKWLSEKFSRVNVFVFILDFIIEAPFKIFVEIAEEWTKYVRERKEEIV